MKKYLFYRIVRSIVSVFLVTTLTYGIIYSLVPRRSIFKDDPNINKLKKDPDKYLDYQNTAFGKMDYIDYLNSKDLVEKVRKDYPEATAEDTPKNKELYTKWTEKNGFTLHQFETSKGFYAVKEISLVQRVGRFYKNLFVIDHPWKVKDPENKNLKRYLKFENDPEVGFSLVGSGTEHRYLLYFNKQFPFIHQNFIKMNLGVSYPTFQGREVTDVIAGGQGKLDSREVTLPDGKKNEDCSKFSNAYLYNDQRFKSFFKSNVWR